MKRKLFFPICCALVLSACNQAPKTVEAPAPPPSKMDALLSKYVPVKLTTDVSVLTDKEKQMIPLLIDAAQVMDDLFWYEAYGDKAALLDGISDEKTRQFVRINYGPWDRLDGNKPFVEGVGEKPLGANFYPLDMTKEAFEQLKLKGKDGAYSFIRKDSTGNYVAVPYHVQFKAQVEKAAGLLRQAAALADDAGLKKYLELRADALLTDNYQPSDLAWMDMKSNTIDVVIGPIENYEDQLFGYRTAHECYVLVKDQAWSKRLAKYAAFLPDLQKGLPVGANYKKEPAGSDSDLNAYDVVYYAGDCNSGSKTIAINLPNDPVVQNKKGSRRLQLKNAMRAKFDKIMVPIANELIEKDQIGHVTFDAFFANTMFHEVAHGLGIKNTINGKGTVQKALKEHYSALEEGKADILGLYMITQLLEKGELEGDIKDYYTTFMAGIFRSVRFGASSAHGKANMIRFNFFKEFGAFEKNPRTGRYIVHYDKMRDAMNALSEKILRLQGDGDYDGVASLVSEKASIGADLQADLDKLTEKNIPTDVVFEQGVAELGLSK